MPAYRILLALVLVVLLVTAVSPGGAEQPLPPVGTVSLEITDVAAGLGVSWGHGTLRFKKKRYAFRVKGLSVLDVGYAKVSARGKVYNLHRVSDFAGTYFAVGAGISLAGGMSGTTMRNQQGVIINLTAVQQGVQFNIGPQGFTIHMP